MSAPLGLGTDYCCAHAVGHHAAGGRDWLASVHRTADPPQEPRLVGELERRDVASLAHDASCSEVEVVSLALAGQRANGVRVATGRVRDVDVSGSQLEGLHVTDGVFAGCDLANIDARRARLTRVSVAASRMTGVRMTEAALQDVVVRECRVDLASFANSRLTRVSFEDCVLAQSDFLDCQLEAVRFHRCSLSQADFRGARMRRCEFRRNDLSGLQGITSLKGAALEWSDVIGLADALAGALGIGVIDEDRDG